jgi:HPr kinase/phosphorylase
MSDEQLTVGRLFGENRCRLKLHWLAGPEDRPERLAVDSMRVAMWSMKGEESGRGIRVVDAQQLGDGGSEGRRELIQELLEEAPFAVVIGDDQRPPESFVEAFEAANIPLFRSPLPAERVYKELIFYQRGLLGESRVLHGVFLEVHGVGMLLSGEAGVGKSELALALVSRGHRFVADDAPEFWRDGEAISGACPPVLQDFIEVRGLGFLDIRSLFGDSAMKLRKNLHLIIHLERMTPERLVRVDRALDTTRYIQILGVQIPMITLPVTAGQQLAVLVETSVRVHIQRRQGYDSNRAFAERQAAIMDQGPVICPGTRGG